MVSLTTGASEGKGSPGKIIVQGQLGKRLVLDLIRELGEKKASGLLRLSSGKTIKAIFFESGSPVFAISNLSSEQLEQRLVRDGSVTFEQIEGAKTKASKPHQLGKALVESGAISAEGLERSIRDLASTIIRSLFEWDQGEYTFDERMRASHEGTLSWSAADCILECVRLSASNERVANLIVPFDSVLTKGGHPGDHLSEGTLTPVESYILSCVDDPIAASDVSTITGLPEEEVRHAVCALVSVRYLKLLGEEEDSDDTPAEAEDREYLEKLHEDVNRKLHFFSTADLYEVLNVTRRASTAEIKASYYKLARRFHPDRYHKPEHADLHSKLELLFARVTQAYETLSDPAQRSPYDARIRKEAASRPLVSSIPLSAQSASAPKVTPIPIHPQPSKSGREQRSSAAGSASRSSEHPASGMPPQQGKIPPVAPLPIPPIPETQQSSAEQPNTPKADEQPVVQHTHGSTLTAEYCYQQGRARMENKDYFGAVQMFREAVRIDPQKPNYQLSLGNALVRNPRTRKEGETHLLKAAQLDPFNAQIHVRLGHVYKEAGMEKRAEQCFRQALSVDPENHAARKELGMIRKKDKKEEVPFWKADVGTIAKRLFKKK